MASREKTDMDIDWVCEQIAEGKMLAHICREIGMSQASFSAWIAAEPERSARAREARITQANTLAERAEEVIADAKDPFELSRAKELAHHYRWKSSKLDPRRFGDKLQVAGDPDGAPIQNKLLIEYVTPPETK